MAGIPIIIQAGPHGLGIAESYYQKFPWEPSPAGDLDLQGAGIVKFPNITFDLLLAELGKASAGGTVLVVCHAHNAFGSILQTSGLLMPLSADAGVSAQDDAFQFLVEASAADRRAKTIRAMPEKTNEEKKAKGDAWIGLATDFYLGFPPNGATLPQLDQFYEKGFDSSARSKLQLQGGARSLRSILAHMERVQSLKLDRVEFRACSIGKDTETMKHLKDVFGCGKLLAPGARTFYGNMPVNTLRQFNNQFIAQHRGSGFTTPGPAGIDPTDLYLDYIRKHPKSRLFWDVEYGSCGSNCTSIKLKDRALAMIVEEVAPSLYRSSAATWHENAKHKPLDDDASKFVHQYIMKQGNYSSGDIMIAGLWTPDEDPPWLLAAETDYVDHIFQV